MLAHVYDRPADNRRSLKELTQALDAVDATFTDAARRGQGPAAAASASASAARGTAKKEGQMHPEGAARGGASAQQKQQRQAAGKSLANPRSAVPHFLGALQAHMRTHKVTVCMGGIWSRPHCSLNSTSPHRGDLLLTYLLTYLLIHALKEAQGVTEGPAAPL